MEQNTSIKESLAIQSFLDDLIANKESHEFEFKSAKGGFPGSFWESYSALANTDGGVIMFGIKEKKGIFHVEPLAEDVVAKYRKNFFDEQQNQASLPLLTDKDVQAYPYGDGYVMAFFIPRATREQRPIYIGKDPLTGTYRRNYEGDYRCSPASVTQMLAERQSSEASVEARILPNYSWDDIDMESYRQYRTIFANLTPAHPWVVLDDLDLMKKLGGYRRDRRTGEEGFTVAGIIMFGKTDAITDMACLPDFMLDYREIPSDTSVVRWCDRLYTDGTWESNLFQFYRKVLSKLQSFLPKPFQLIGDTRYDEGPAHEAVREALINMLVHPAYGKSPRLVVEKRPDCIVLSNPGTLLISQAQYYEGGHSECRNPSLQKMFGLIGRSDKAGSGVDKILKGWQSAKWRRPYVTEKANPDMVELYMPLETLFSDEVMSELKQLFGEEIIRIEHDKLNILALALTDGEVSNSTLQKYVNIHPAEITKLLKSLCSAGMLQPTGFGRGTVYRLNREADLASSDLASSDLASSNVPSSNVPSSDVPSSNVPSSNVPSSDVPSSFHKAETDEFENVKTMIIHACRYKWLTAKEISLCVGRNQRHTRRVINQLLASGDLKAQYPEQPTHPSQRYTAARQ